MRKIHVTRQFFEPSGLHCHFLEKTKKKNIFRYGLGECVYRISGLCRFSFGQEVPYKPTNQQTHSQVKIGISSTGCSPQVDFDYIALCAINQYLIFAKFLRSCFLTIELKTDLALFCIFEYLL